MCAHSYQVSSCCNTTRVIIEASFTDLIFLIFLPQIPWCYFMMSSNYIFVIVLINRQPAEKLHSVSLTLLKQEKGKEKEMRRLMKIHCFTILMELLQRSISMGWNVRSDYFWCQIDGRRQFILITGKKWQKQHKEKLPFFFIPSFENVLGHVFNPAAGVSAE